MKRAYDDTIEAHYNTVARQDADSPLSTMADAITRALETDAILSFVASALSDVRARDGTLPLRLIDVGCGNGYTLSRIAARFSREEVRLSGAERNDALRSIASNRAELKGAEIFQADVRDPSFAQSPYDILICQRVLINLLDGQDQKDALKSLLNAMKPKGAMLFIEGFQSGLKSLNTARREFDLAEIPPAEHNLYLEDDFFDNTALKKYVSDRWPISETHFSTHYFVARVLHPTVLQDRAFIRNSEFVKFFSAALPAGVGNYSPLKIKAFNRD